MKHYLYDVNPCNAVVVVAFSARDFLVLLGSVQRLLVLDLASDM